MLAEEVEIVALVAAEALVLLHVLVLHLVLLGLLRERARQVREGVRQVMTGEAAPVRRHRGCCDSPLLLE